MNFNQPAHSDIDNFCNLTFQRGIYTNYYNPPRELHAQADKLKILQADSGAILFLDRGDFYRIYYALSSFNIDFKLDKPTVIEIAYKNRLPDAVDHFISGGFEKALTRSRMTGGGDAADRTAPAPRRPGAFFHFHF